VVEVDGTSLDRTRHPGAEEMRMVCAIAQLALSEAVRQGVSAATFRGFRVQAVCVCVGVVRTGDGTGRPVRLTVRFGDAGVEGWVLVQACEVRREPTPCAHGPLD
jgi:hypothetical protein